MPERFQIYLQEKAIKITHLWTVCYNENESKRTTTMNETAKFIFTILGSGTFLAFVQFLINRFDTKHDKLVALEKKIDEGLDDRDKLGKARYEEYLASIEEMSHNHQKDFQELQKAISHLVENDAKFAESIEKMVKKQDIIASANVGMIHNTIITFTDPIIERNSVTYDELANLDSLYVPYSKLGGNGECKRRYEDVNKLIKISREEATKRDRKLETDRYKEIQKIVGA